MLFRSGRDGVEILHELRDERARLVRLARQRRREHEAGLKTAGAAFVVAVVVFSGAAFVVLPGAAVTVLSVVASAAVVSAAVSPGAFPTTTVPAA